jgi:3-methyladenine DNA glycosylase AlkD
MRYPINLVFPRGATTVPDLRKAAKSWATQNRDAPIKDFEELVTALIGEASSTKKCMGGLLLGYMPVQRRMLDPFLYDHWLDHAEGWSEVDGLCYGYFTSEEILGNFRTWQRLIADLAQSGNINKRRAAAVLLTKPVTQTKDQRLGKLAFLVIDKLRSEKDILITKAVSWLLRNLIKHYREEVAEYLRSNREHLPAIAVRETFNKLKTGRKSGK